MKSRRFYFPRCFSFFYGFLLFFLVSSCIGGEEVLQGERKEINDSAKPIFNSKAVFNKAYNNKAWLTSSRNSYNSLGHIFSGINYNSVNKYRSLNLASLSSSSGGSRNKLRIFSSPLYSEGIMYIMLPDSQIISLDSKDFSELWTVQLKPSFFKDNIFKGGMSLHGGKLAVVTAYGNLTLLDAKTGRVLWQVEVSALPESIPTIDGNRVFVLFDDGNVIAYDIRDGMELWSYKSLTEKANVFNALSMPFDQSHIYVPSMIGELIALNKRTGKVVWSNNLLRSFATNSLSSLNVITSSPVIDASSGYIFISSLSGELAAYRLISGDKIWSSSLSLYLTPIISGTTVFAFTTSNDLVAINKLSGKLYWKRHLSGFDNKGGGKFSAMSFVNGSILLFNSNGSVNLFSAADGKEQGNFNLGSSVQGQPVFIDDWVLVVNSNNEAVVYR